MSHRNGGLGAEILDNHFLDVAVSVMQVADGEQGIDAIFQRFADADQQTRGEWNLLFSSVLDRPQTLGRNFVGSVVVGGAGSEQGVAGGFEHKTHAGRNDRQTGDPFGAEQTWIRMRQQAGLAQNQFAHGFQIVQRGLITQLPQGSAHLGEKHFRLIA